MKDIYCFISAKPFIIICIDMKDEALKILIIPSPRSRIKLEILIVGIHVNLENTT